ncbi:hypothetical protein DSO57_1016992 [Entomophthora muscae]|uniref:Uncharacterized protein n=1 Tax=Entomophthora muscae TaxID=34485 RepID=A0ACC2RJD7_9FUNG|nr:hypothetical protein DSO57_1016992 [Entomophthora muscae]
MLLFIAVVSGIFSAAVQAHMPAVWCGKGKGPTPNPYRNSDVLLPYMRDLKSKNECRLSRTPARVFHTIHNQCQEPSKKGQCTEWTDGRFYQLTGEHVEFSGPAHSWPTQARRKPGKWVVSKTPIFPSVVILPPGMHGSSSAGHAAVLESSFPSGDVCTSNWNAPTLGKLSLLKIRHKPGMLYITLK